MKYWIYLESQKYDGYTILKRKSNQYLKQFSKYLLHMQLSEIMENVILNKAAFEKIFITKHDRKSKKCP